MKNTIVYLIRHAEQLKLKDCMKNITNSYQINNEKIILSINGEKQGQKIAIISHGAAIKFMLMKWCELNQDNQIIFNKKIIIEEKLELPDVIKLTFNDIKLVDIEKIKL